MKKLFLFFLLFFFSTQVQAMSLENYCVDGYYKIPNEKVCSRAPKCGGKNYEEVAALPEPNPQECMGDNDGQRIGCQGYVPLCCYEIVRTGDPTMCVGYWERLWCHPDQCAKIDQEKGRVCNGGHPGTCRCGYAFRSWCQGADAPRPPVSLEMRLGVKFSTSTPTPSSFSTIKQNNTPANQLTQPFIPTLIVFTPKPTKPVYSTIYPSPTPKPQYQFPTFAYPQVSTLPTPSLMPRFSLTDMEAMTEQIKIIYQENSQKVKKEVQAIKEPVINGYSYIKRIDTQLENFINVHIINLFNHLKQIFMSV